MSDDEAKPKEMESNGEGKGDDAASAGKAEEREGDESKSEKTSKDDDRGERDGDRRRRDDDRDDRRRDDRRRDDRRDDRRRDDRRRDDRRRDDDRYRSRRDDYRRRSRSKSRDRRRRSPSRSRDRSRDRSKERSDRSKYEGDDGQQLTATQKLQQMMAKAKEANPTLLADQGTRKARRLYVGNLPIATVNVTEQMLVDFFNAAVMQAGIVLQGLGGLPVVSAWVSTEAEKNFAFVEFRTMEECANALSLNGIGFHGESLRISRPSDFDDAVRAMQAQGIVIPQMGMTLPTAAGGMLGGMPAGMPAMAPMGVAAMSAAPAATAAIKLKNMMKPSDLNDPQDIEDIKEDVKEECSSYGPVKAVHIPGKGEPGAGNVYVVMSTTGDAVKAHGVMHGRMFDGQQIVATFYDVAKAEAGQFE